MNANTHLAIDIGASGGRHILGWLDNKVLRTEEIHRFQNSMFRENDNLCWNVDAIFYEVLIGLKKCTQLGKTPCSVGIDTWGVDFVLLDKVGNRVGPAVAYRDNRTDGIDEAVYKCVSESELYDQTGIQKQLFNTIFQLMAIQKKTPHLFDNAAYMLMMPDYLHYRLCGVMKTEYTNATTTGLVNAKSKTWDEGIIERCGFPRGLFGEIVPAGTTLGRVTDEIKRALGYDCTVILPPTHDTASAFLAVPDISGDSVYISSGTWSLMGVELSSPITSEFSREANFTNEGGYGYRFRFLKNIMGLWILQSVRKEIKEDVTFDELVALARASSCDSVIDVSSDRFFAPASMVGEIQDACRESGQEVPESSGDLASCVYRGLASSYARTVKELELRTNLDFSCINIIGGGSKDEYLNELTARECGLPVYAGPAEGTSLGNIVSQMMSCGEIPDVESARGIIYRSFNIQEIMP